MPEVKNLLPRALYTSCMAGYLGGARRIRWLAVLCLGIGSPGAAEPTGPDPAESPRYPFVSAAYAVLPSAELEAVGGRASLKTKETQLALGLPQFDAGGLAFDLGVDYQYTRYAYEGVDGRNRDLHRLQFPVGLSHRSAALGLDAFIAPGVGTSSNVLKDIFDRGGSDDFVVTGRIEATFWRGDRFGWIAGAAYDRSFGEAKPYPVLGLRYAPGSRARLRLAFPDPALEFRAAERHNLSLRLFPAGFEWHVVSDELGRDFDYRVEGIRLQGVWSYRALRSAWLDISVGYEFDRRHEFVDDTGRPIASAVGSEALVMLGLRWGDGPVPSTHRVARLPFDR